MESPIPGIGQYYIVVILPALQDFSSQNYKKWNERGTSDKKILLETLLITKNKNSEKLNIKTRLNFKPYQNVSQ